MRLPLFALPAVLGLSLAATALNGCTSGSVGSCLNPQPFPPYCSVSPGSGPTAGDEDAGASAEPPPTGAMTPGQDADAGSGDASTATLPPVGGSGSHVSDAGAVSDATDAALEGAVEPIVDGGLDAGPDSGLDANPDDAPPVGDAGCDAPDEGSTNSSKKSAEMER